VGAEHASVIGIRKLQKGVIDEDNASLSCRRATGEGPKVKGVAALWGIEYIPEYRYME
jgi:hypothetical protein